jgi:tRNA(fMet)-specific endonuclease VapC
MRYMLDTDIASYFMKGSNPGLMRRMQELEWDDFCISCITKSELLFGVEVSPRRQKEAEGVELFLRYVNVMDLPSEAAAEYAGIRAELQRKGTPIGANDLFIAAHARHLGLTLVTNNTREYSRVPGLKIENWAEDS